MTTGIELGEPVAIDIPSTRGIIEAPLTYGRPGPPGPQGPAGPAGSPFASLDTAGVALFDPSDVDNETGWAGGDVADNMRLNNGSDLFVWGDTFIADLNEDGSWNGGWQFHRRSLTIQAPGQNIADAALYDQDSDLLAPLKVTPGAGVDQAAEWTWFGGLAGIDGGTKAYAFAQGMVTTPDGPPGWNYKESRRTCLAELDVSDPASPVLVKWDQWAKTDPNTGVIWGDCAWEDPDGWIYVTGRTPRPDTASDAYIVRVPASDPWGAQQVWTGTAWVAGGTPAPIGTFPAVPSGIRKIGDTWFGLVAPFYATALQLWSSRSLTGGWGNVGDVYHYDNNDDVFYYSPRWVPQWDNDTGLAVIVPHNSKSDPVDPWEYQPTVIRLSRLVTQGNGGGIVDWSTVANKPVNVLAVETLGDVLQRRYGFTGHKPFLSANGTTIYANADPATPGVLADVALRNLTVAGKVGPHGRANGSWLNATTDASGGTTPSFQGQATWGGGIVKVHVDFKRASASAGVDILQLPADVPAPADFVDAICPIATTAGQNAILRIPAGSRTVRAYSVAANTRYMGDLIFHI